MANQGLNGINPLAYMGVNPYTPAATQTYPRSPTANDSVGFSIGDVWVEVPPGYLGSEKVYILISLNQGLATWAQLYPGSGSTLQFETDAGTVNPVAGIVNILGDGVKITTSGAGNTITITGDTDVATDYVTDSGTATPSSSVLHINGGLNINTSGAGNVVTVNLDNSISVSSIGVTVSSTFDGPIHVIPFNEGVVQSDASGILSSTAGNNGEILIGATGGAPAWANIISSDASVTIVNNANSIDLQVAGGGGGNTIVSTFTSSGTWTKNVSTNYVEVYGVCGGGGGASGGITTDFIVPGQIHGGGGGGGTYGSFFIEGPAVCFPASVPITVGAGGLGGVGVTGNGQLQGNIGGEGSASFFGSIGVSPSSEPDSSVDRSGGGIDDGGGNPTSIAVGYPGNWGKFVPDRGYVINSNADKGAGVTSEGYYGYGGGASTVGAIADTGVGQDGMYRGLQLLFDGSTISTYLLGAGGGGGGTFDNPSTGPQSGGAGGSIYSSDGTTVLVAGGSAGVPGGPIDGGNGATGLSGDGIFAAGGGGGGGAAVTPTAPISPASGNGGDGGFPGGAGGGGGGSFGNINIQGTSGNGGNGADGVVIIIEYT